MNRCWRCRGISYAGSIHHINGDGQDDRISNKIRLCLKCHDFVQGICGKCDQQVNCYVKRFQLCWKFEDNVPPIYFRNKIEGDSIMISVDNDKPSIKTVHCAICKVPFQKLINAHWSVIFCDKCLISLIELNFPNQWKMLQKWKIDLETVEGYLNSLSSGI